MVWGGKTAGEKNAELRPINREVKNVIPFIGGGMGLSTVTAACIQSGQQPDIIDPSNTKPASSGEENSLCFEIFPHLALSKNLQHQPATA